MRDGAAGARRGFALYAIADAEMLERRGVGLREFAKELRAGGVGWVQWRCKGGTRREVLDGAAVLLEEFAGSGCRLILNDYPELVGKTGFDGVHVGQGDLPAAKAREVIGPGKVLGVSTHDEEQLRVAAAGPADYVAIGPVFGTSTKVDAEPVVGLEGVRRARSLTSKPVVAIGGITAENAAQVLEAGADVLAVIGALFVPGQEIAESLRRLLGSMPEQTGGGAG